MKSYFLIIFATLFLCISCELQASKPLAYPSWPPKIANKPSNLKSGLRTLVVQIRGSGNSRMPAIVIKRTPQHVYHHQSLVQRPVRPYKTGISPQFVLKGQHLAKRPGSPSSTIVKLSSPKPQNNYGYEKPFVPAAYPSKQPIENSIHLTNGHFGPIHTIPAPNLSSKPGPIYDSHDNHLHFDDNIFTPRPAVYHSSNQYQVTEEPTYDQTLRDPISGQQKYFAPDPDPSLPAIKIRPSTDPLSMPSNGQPLPLDVHSNLLVSNNVQPLAHFIKPLAQQQLPDTYNLPISSQPQLQQYLLQQTSAVAGMPLSVYNPTYLVTQSNNLYNQHQQQHKQQLLQPSPNFIKTIIPNNLFTPSDGSQDVASYGQVLQAARDDPNQIYPEFTNHVNGAPFDKPTFQALTANHNGQGIPNYYLDAQTLNSGLHSTDKPILSEYSTDNIESQGGFVASNFFGHNQIPESYQFVDITQGQVENDKILAQANLELQNQQISAYEQHQRELQKQLSTSSLRIFVPDDEYDQQSTNLQKRSDDYADEKNEEPRKSTIESTIEESNDKLH